jgi:OPT family oligopeptide transporter
MPSSTKPASAAEEAMGGKAAQQGGEGERYPVEEVALVVPETDDPSTPVMTFRAWTLGLTSCVVLIFLNTFFTYRTQPLTISGILAQILVLPVGRFMASVLPDREVKLLGGRLGSFNLNPGPFNIKEHVIITIFANCGVSFGGGDAYSIGAITVMKAYYKQTLSFVCALLLVLTTQVRWLLCILIIRAWLLAPFTIYF